MASADRLEDRLAVRELLTMYAKAVDRQDWNLYREVFTEDAKLDYATGLAIMGINVFGCPNGNVDQAVKYLSASLKFPFSKTQHLISNIEVDFTSDTEANVRAMFYNPMVLMMLPWFSFFSTGGWYIHKVRKCSDGKWRSTFIAEEIAYNSVLYSFFNLALYLFALYKIFFVL